MLHHDAPDSAGVLHILTVFPLIPPQLREILMGSNWNIYETHGVRDAELFLHSRQAQVILCHCSLADGSWKDILACISDLPAPPRLIVTSETTDEFLWAEVLNLGGYDVIAQPFWEPEVVRTLNSALRRSTPASSATPS